MLKVLIFISIVFIFIALRVKMRKNIVKMRGNVQYAVSARVYLWQILGSAIIFTLLALIIALGIDAGITPYTLSLVFVILVSIIAGICSFALVLYGFTPIGIYDNGILTHFSFFHYEEIDCFKVTYENKLNTGSNTKTLVFKLKEATHNTPNFEYHTKDEDTIRSILLGHDLKEYLD